MAALPVVAVRTRRCSAPAGTGPRRRGPVTRSPTLVAAAAAAVLVLGGCVEPGDPPAPSSSALGSGSVTRSGGDVAVSPVPVTLDEVVASLNAYWSRADAELGFEYVPVPADRVVDGRTAVCSGRPVESADVEDNAFVDPDCSEGLLVAYDADYLATARVRLEGTLSHEWGHVVQAQATDVDISLDPGGLPVDAELQADCLSGAWARDNAESSYEDLARDVRESGDPAGVAADDTDAHGTPQERIAAFDIGWDNGPSGCVSELLDVLPG